MIYLDTSAMVKLTVLEAESDALVKWLRASDDHDYVTNAIGRVELMRSALRANEAEITDKAKDVLDGLDILAITDGVIELAETVGASTLRTLDALHLASISQIESALTAVLTYDKRLIDGCRDLGFPVASPI